MQAVQRERLADLGRCELCGRDEVGVDVLFAADLRDCLDDRDDVPCAAVQAEGLVVGGDEDAEFAGVL